MGEIADMLLDGTLDFYTGEYIGRGYGIPRTKNKTLAWEKRKKGATKTDYTATKEMAYNGIKNYITQKWNGSASIPSVRQIVMEYLGETNIDLKQKCTEIQQDFGAFVLFINKKLKDEQ